jgi:hypothetical protein
VSGRGTKSHPLMPYSRPDARSAGKDSKNNERAIAQKYE